MIVVIVIMVDFVNNFQGVVVEGQSWNKLSTAVLFGINYRGGVKWEKNAQRHPVNNLNASKILPIPTMMKLLRQIFRYGNQ